MRIPGVGQAIDNLVKWSEREEWAPYRDEVFAEHLDMILEQFEMTAEEVFDLLGSAFGMVYGFMLEDFLTAQFGEEGELNIIDDYLKRRGWREKVPARRYLEAIRDSTPSLYEVTDLDPGHSMTVRDLVLGGDPVTVEEKRGSESAARWDCLAGRIVVVNKKPHFTGGLLLVPHQLADEILSAIDDMAKQLGKELRKEAKKHGDPVVFDRRDVRNMVLSESMTCCVFTQYWLTDALDKAFAPLPEIRNSDGDRIVFSEIRFPINGDSAKIAAILDGIVGYERYEVDELHWAWLKPGSPSQRMSRSRQEEFEFVSEDQTGETSLGDAEIVGDVLILKTNSTERAERGREVLATHLGTLVGSPLTSHQSLEKMLEDRPESESAEPDVPPEVAEQAIHAYLDDHYRRTLDDPIPILDGRTPRQAVKTKKGRAQVVDWLKQLENSEFRRAAREGQKPYDSAWMWRELKLKEPV